MRLDGSTGLTVPRKKSPELTFQVAGLDEIRRWVLSLGPEACVIEPERLRELVQESLTRSLAQYTPGRELKKESYGQLR